MKKTYIMKTVCAVGLTAACAWGLAGCSSDGNASSGTGGVAGTVNGVEIAEDTITNYIQGVREQLGADDEDSWGTWLSQNDYTPASVREEVFNSYAQRELLKEGVEEKGITVESSEIDEQIDALREHYYSFEDASAATKVKEDSYIDLAMKATDDKGEEIPSLTTENRPYGLGANLFPAEFDEQLVGLKKGQTATFTLDMPADPPIMLSALAGKTEKINFEVEVKVVKKKIVPEVNDEWAKEQMGFESVEDLRARIAESVTSQKADMMPRLKENACLYALAERVEGDVPEAMLEDAEASLIQDFFQQLQSQGMTFDVYLAQQGITPDQFKEDVKKQAEDMSKQDLALDAWARHFGMEATAEEVTEEFVKSGVEDPAALEAEWRSNGQLHMVRQGVIRTKAVKDIMDKAVVTELDLSKKKDEEKKPAKKAAAKKTAKKDEAEAPAAE